MRFLASTLFLCLAWSGASAETSSLSQKHRFLFGNEHSAQLHCPNDTVVWANTASHTLHLRGDHHFAHTHGGFACESEARARGYRGPTAHT
jgi:hypothetical protein